MNSGLPQNIKRPRRSEKDRRGRFSYALIFHFQISYSSQFTGSSNGRRGGGRSLPLPCSFFFLPLAFPAFFPASLSVGPEEAPETRSSSLRLSVEQPVSVESAGAPEAESSLTPITETTSDSAAEKRHHSSRMPSTQTITVSMQASIMSPRRSPEVKQAIGEYFYGVLYSP